MGWFAVEHLRLDGLRSLRRALRRGGALPALATAHWVSSRAGCIACSVCICSMALSRVYLGSRVLSRVMERSAPNKIPQPHNVAPCPSSLLEFFVTRQ